MAKFIKLEDWSWLNIDKIERIYTEMSTWQEGKMAYVESIIHAITTGGKIYKVLDIIAPGIIPDGEQWSFSAELDETANLKLEDIAERLATISANPEKTVAKVPVDMRMNLIIAMNAIVNNTTAEGAKECE